MREHHELDFEAGASANSLEQGLAPAGNTAARAASEAAVSQRAQTLGAMSNTPYSSSKFGIISEDTAHLSIWVDWGCDEADFFARCERALLESQGKIGEEGEAAVDGEVFIDGEYFGTPEPDFTEDFAQFEEGGSNNDFYIEGYGKGFMEFGGQLWRMMRSGKGSGDDNRNSYYRYHLKSGDVDIFLRRDKHESVSNMWLEIGSVSLCRCGGLRNALDEIYAVFKAQGITVLKEILSRVDVYADYDSCKIHEFCDRMFNGSYITRARHIHYFGEDALDFSLHLDGRKYTGFSIGTQIHLRCYDKREEMKNDPIKWAVFAEKYDGIPDDLTRVEFQLRRKGLKDIQVMADDGAEPGRIEDVDSYLKVRNNLWRYLACEWFRFTEKPVDRKNKNNSKAKTWSTWEMVQNSVSSACESAKRTRRAVQVNPEHMKKMALGVVMGAAMLERPGEIASAGDLVRYFRDVIIEGGRDYFLEVKEKHSLRYFMRAGNALGNA